MKRCTRCELEHPEGAFYRDATFPSGYRPECKVWTRARRRGRTAAGLTQAADRARYQRSPQHRATVARNTKQWKARNPEKLRAEEAVAKAIRCGEMTRQPCAVCGAKAHAHHADYTRPLEVQWLCPLHHARQHVVEGRLDHLRATA